jgi:hypothetical protein
MTGQADHEERGNDARDESSNCRASLNFDDLALLEKQLARAFCQDWGQC